MFDWTIARFVKIIIFANASRPQSFPTLDIKSNNKFMLSTNNEMQTSHFVLLPNPCIGLLFNNKFI
jgi:hypothetical protein